MTELPGGPAGSGAGTGAKLRGGLLGEGDRAVGWGAEPSPGAGLVPTFLNCELCLYASARRTNVWSAASLKGPEERLVFLRMITSYKLVF